MKEQSIILFSAEIDIQDFINGDMKLDLNVANHKNMTVEEFEEFKEYIGDAALIVRNAGIRALNEEQGEYFDEDFMEEK